jgi:hypothetical protein
MAQADTTPVICKLLISQVIFLLFFPLFIYLLKYFIMLGNGFNQAYGVFETRAKVPNVAGAWPAFWPYSNHRYTNGSLPHGIYLFPFYCLRPYCFLKMCKN